MLFIKFKKKNPEWTEELAKFKMWQFVSRPSKTGAWLLTQKATDAATLCHFRKMLEFPK